MTETPDEEFIPFPKIPRLNRDCVVTEKIDGSNGAIHIQLDEHGETFMTVQSRKRIITPGKTTDNQGFAQWAFDNFGDLVAVLGYGLHYGEWWGSGINRGYGLQNGEKRFSLFNRKRWGWMDDPEQEKPDTAPDIHVPGLYVTPKLYEGLFDTHRINAVVAELRENGSIAVPGFKDPEGVVVFNKAGNHLFKVTCEKDDEWKGLGERE